MKLLFIGTFLFLIGYWMLFLSKQKDFLLQNRYKEKEKGVDLKEELVDEQKQPEQVERHGFVVLGMHRSGTSMLSGLLVEGCGYKVGSPTYKGPANPKGFFELGPAVNQNDEFLEKQRASWRFGVGTFNNTKAIQQYKNGEFKFKSGKKALDIFNNAQSAPWLWKDPRLCITLPTWLPLLATEPAIVFTYRHPMEVANSLKKREGNFGLVQGFRLWIHYNTRGIQNSRNLCRVVTSNRAVLQNPLQEVQRISDELASKCNVVNPPGQVTQEIVDEFVDPTLQHHKTKQQEQQQGSNDKQVLHDYGNGCKAYEFDSSYKGGTRHEKEVEMYKKAMQLFCDMESREAFEPTYQWPELP